MSAALETFDHERPHESPIQAAEAATEWRQANCDRRPLGVALIDEIAGAQDLIRDILYAGIVAPVTFGGDQKSGDTLLFLGGDDEGEAVEGRFNSPPTADGLVRLEHRGPARLRLQGDAFAHDADRVDGDAGQVGVLLEQIAAESLDHGGKAPG